MECGNWGEAERWREVGAGERKSHGVCCAVECGLKRVLLCFLDRQSCNRCAFAQRKRRSDYPLSADYDDLGDGVMVGGGSFVPDINRPNNTRKQRRAQITQAVSSFIYAFASCHFFCFGSALPEIGIFSLSLL